MADFPVETPDERRLAASRQAQVALSEQQQNPDDPALQRDAARAQAISTSADPYATATAGMGTGQGSAPAAPAPQDAPPKWGEITSLPKYKQLTDEQKIQVRDSYWLDVLKPRVPTDQLDEAWSAFKEASDPRSEFLKGLQGGTLGANPQMAGNALEAMGVLTDSDWAKKSGRTIADAGQGILDRNQADVPSIANVRTDSVSNFLEDFGKYAAYQTGSGIGTTLPSAVSGGLTAFLTKKPLLGLALGAAAPSYIQNLGSVYGDAKDDEGIKAAIKAGKITQKDVAGISAVAAVPIAALDTLSLEHIIGGVAFKEAKGNLIKRIVKRMADGALTEGTTEGLQQVIQEWAQKYMGGNKSLRDQVISVADNFLGGAFVGGAMGGAAHGHQQGTDEHAGVGGAPQPGAAQAGSQGTGAPPAPEPGGAVPAGQVLGTEEPEAPPQQPPGEQPQPEPQETTQAQLEALAQGRKRAVLVTPGEKAPAELPEGTAATKIPGRGVLIHRVDDQQAVQLAKSGRMGDALGLGMPEKPAQPGPAVTARDAQGRVVQEAITDGRPQVEQAAAQAAGPGGTVEVRSPQAALAERAQAVAQEQQTSPQPVSTAAEPAPDLGQTPEATQPAAPVAQTPESSYQTPVDEGAHQAATSTHNELPEPTKPQIEANNAKLGHARVAGMEISVENPAGATRKDIKHTPPQWQVEMRHHYGYIRGTIGHDKDHLDAFVKPGTPEDYSGKVYVVNQNHPDGAFDEHKSMIGFGSEEEARRAYLDNFDNRARAAKQIRSIVPMNLSDFKAWAFDKTKNGPSGGELDHFWADRRALPNFKKGDRVEFTQRGTFTQPDGTKREGRRVVGTVEKIQDKQQGTVKVIEDGAGDWSVRAANLKHYEGGSNAVPESGAVGRSVRGPAGPGNEGEGARVGEGNAGRVSQPAETRPKPREEAKPSPGEETPQAQRTEPAQRSEELSSSQIADVAVHVAMYLASGGSYGSITEARSKLGQKVRAVIKPGTIAAKQLDEAIEEGVIRAARTIVKKMRERGRTDEEIYASLRDLYARQPNLNVRTSTSINDQAYSTPVPLSFIASRLAGVTTDTQVYEPTAGNGSLLIEVGTKEGTNRSLVNEINEARAEALRHQGFRVHVGDATEFNPKGNGISGQGAEVILANPPFGYVKDENGRNREWQITKEYRTNQIDHAIAMKALEAMKDDGRAVLIVGAPKEGKVDGYDAAAKRAFYFTLYRDYNVTDHFTVAGDLYAKQGAAWPVDVVVIDGRGKSSLRLPQAVQPRLYDSWAKLKEVLNAAPATSDRGQGAAAPAPGAEGPAEAPAGVRRRPAREGGAESAPQQRGKSEPSVSRPVREQPAAAGLAEGKGNRGGERPSRGELRGPGRQADTGLSGRVEQSDVGKAFDQEFNKLFGNLEQAPKRGQNEPASEAAPGSGAAAPSPGSLVGEAGREAGAGIEEAAKALNALFGAPGRVGAGLQFDEQTYAKARPHFLSAWNHFTAAAKNLNEAVNLFLQGVRSKMGLAAEAIQRMKNYLVKFVEDVRAGNIKEAVLPKFMQKAQPEAQLERGSRPQETETEHQKAYAPKSSANSIGSLVPANMQRVTGQSLDALVSRVGNIDEYVAKELGYDLKDIPKYFLAEQVDALGLALDSLKRGSGFIIGDQTGIGKGRVNAGVIRWAIRNDKVPIFVTEKPNLYGDMIRDLTDIGMPDVAPVITNNNANVPLDDEAALYWAEHETQAEAARAAGERPPRMLPVDERPGKWLKTTRQEKTLMELVNKGSLAPYDTVFTTYNQMQTVDGKTPARHDFLREFSDGAVVIFDESHNAGGTEQKEGGPKDDTPKRSDFARGLLQNAHSAFYSSATYAKRPDVMDLYFRTDMSKAVDNVKALVTAIKDGGVPLQQVVAAMLAKAGQYIRREKSFAGISYDTKVLGVNRPVAEKVSQIMRQIADFDHAKGAAVEAMDKSAKDSAKRITEDGSIGSAGVHSTNFTSLMHNIVNQMLLALKTAEIGDEVVAAIKRGEKPVLTVANTMGSFIEDYVDDHNVNPGDAIAISFQDLLHRYLERSRDVVEGNAYGQKTRHRLSDDELGPNALAMWKNIEKNIKDSPVLADIPLSPIDFIKSRVEKEGFKFGEITGRQHALDYSAPTPVYRRRSGAAISIGGRKATIAQFNNGVIDVLLINQAGATGLSLHSSEKFKDQRQRHMIIIQAEGNIDTHMQVLGRINRTGQVTKDGKGPAGKAAVYGLPKYTQLVADVPAEKRPAAVLAKKMASLNANTTASRGSAVTSTEVVDFMNQYGDQVAASLMADNPDWHAALDHPLPDDDKGDGLKKEEAMRKVTGRIPLLTIAKQEELYDLLESEYQSLLEEKDRLGENALEAKTLDLQARVLKTTPVFEGKGGDSPFASGAQAELSEVKKLGKAYTSEELLGMLRDRLGSEDEANHAEIQNDGRARSDKQIEEMQAEFTPYLLEETGNAKSDAARKAIETKLTAMHDRLERALSAAPIGRPVMLHTKFGNVLGVAVNVERKGKPKNPAALGAWKFTFAVADAVRNVTIPASRLFTPGFAPDSSIDTGAVVVEGYERPQEFRGKPMFAEFDEAGSQSHEHRVIITGNLLAGFQRFDRGRIVYFTTEDGSVRQGILMAQGFDLDKAINEQPIQFEKANDALDFLRTMTAENRAAVLVSKEHQLYRVAQIGHTNDFRIAVAGAKNTGGPIYLSRMVTNAAGQDFVKAGQTMRVDLPYDRAAKTLQAIIDLGYSAQMMTHREEAKNFLAGRGVKFSEGWDSIDSALRLPENAGDVAYPRRPRADQEIHAALNQVTAALRGKGLDIPEESLQAVRPTDPGAVRGLSDALVGRGRDLSLAQRVAAHFGHEVVFFENHAASVWNMGGFAMHSMPGKVFVNIDAPSPATFITLHELYHRMKRERPDLHDKFDAAMRPMLRNVESYRHTVATTPEALREEVYADFLGWNGMKPEFWRELAGRSPSFFKRIADYVGMFLDSVAKAFQGRWRDASKFVTDVKDAREHLINVLNQWQAGKHEEGSPANDIAFSDLPAELGKGSRAAAREALGNDRGLLDRVVSLPFKLIRWDKVIRRAGAIVQDLNERATEASPVYEAVRAGVQSHYGLPEEYQDRRVEMQTNLQRWARGAADILDKIMTLSREQSKVAYEWMTQYNEADLEAMDPVVAQRIRERQGKVVSKLELANGFDQLPEQAKQTLRDLRELIRGLGEQAVALGQLSPEVFKRNELAYLHRSYYQHELMETLAKKIGNRKNIAVWGEQYKGRGLTDWRSLDNLSELAGEPINPATLKGRKFRRLELRAKPPEETVGDESTIRARERLGKLRKVVYWPLEKAVPSKYASWRNDGLWEVRWYKGGKWGLWRDFSAAEREAMGEIDEVRFAVAKTIHLMTHDVEVGRMQKWVSDTYATDKPPDGARVVTAREAEGMDWLAIYRRNVWVRVPDSKVSGTNTLRYGALAGRYVPGPIWNDIRQHVGLGRRGNAATRLWDDSLRLWKMSKTALSPGVHMNNVMANFFIADFHDLRSKDLLKALTVMVDSKFGTPRNPDNAALYRRFEDSGALQGMFKYHELKREVLDPLLEEIRREAIGDEQTAMLRTLSVISALNQLSRAGNLAKRGANAMVDAYSAEDEVFRLAMFIKAIRHGLPDLEAGKLARKAFLDYDINAPWIQALRRTAFPFIAFPYRAIPMMVHTFATKPWKPIKYVLVAALLNTLAYWWLGLGPADEKKERALLPEEKSGDIVGLFPKMVRMPWNGPNDAPVFLDVRRWFPSGDVFDVGGTHAALPMSPTAIPGGPLALMAELFANKDQFTGQDITLETDTLQEKLGKVGLHLYRFAAPNLFMIPGSWSFEGLRGAGALSPLVNPPAGEGHAVTDVFGQSMSLPQAFGSALGVKLGTYPEDVLRYNLQRRANAQINEIMGNIYKASGDLQRHKISREDFQKYAREQMEKVKQITEDLRSKVAPGRP